MKLAACPQPAARAQTVRRLVVHGLTRRSRGTASKSRLFQTSEPGADSC
jgi:hypothetical protein